MISKPALPWNLEIRREFRARVRTEVVQADTGIAVKTSDWIENLAFDTALSFLAGNNAGFAGVFATLKIGSGTNANSFAGGAVTFTQSGFTLTASGSFFTSAMVGAKFKYGTS